MPSLGIMHYAKPALHYALQRCFDCSFADLCLQNSIMNLDLPFAASLCLSDVHDIASKAAV